MEKKPKIYRFGNEFWIEGGWHAAASVVLRRAWSEEYVRTFYVGFSSPGSDTPEDQRLRAKAILAACHYAERCTKSTKTDDQLQEVWDRELREFYKSELYVKWNPKPVSKAATLDCGHAYNDDCQCPKV